jgi:hypothetical protein
VDKVQGSYEVKESDFLMLLIGLGLGKLRPIIKMHQSSQVGKSVYDFSSVTPLRLLARHSAQKGSLYFDSKRMDAVID